MSFTNTVPASVPSVLQSVDPCTPSSATKNASSPTVVRNWGNELNVAITRRSSRHSSNKGRERAGRDERERILRREEDAIDADSERISRQNSSAAILVRGGG